MDKLFPESIRRSPSMIYYFPKGKVTLEVYGFCWLEAAGRPQVTEEHNG